MDLGHPNASVQGSAVVASLRTRASREKPLRWLAKAFMLLRATGPAILFENFSGHTMPVLGNLFGTPERRGPRDGRGGVERSSSVWRSAGVAEGMCSLLKTLWSMAPKELRSAPCQEVGWEGNDVDMVRLTIQHCRPGEVAPLITWGLVITQGPNKPRQNLGIYRQQVLNRNQAIMRWLAHRGGALDFREHGLKNPGQTYPVVVAICADPSTILGAVYDCIREQFSTSAPGQWPVLGLMKSSPESCPRNSNLNGRFE